MSEPMQVWVEVWPIAADQAGIWLVSGADAWRPRLPVMADSEPWAEARLELSDHGTALDDLLLLHQTSSRVDGPRFVTTHVAVLDVYGEPVRARWPEAQPVSLALAEAVGKPPTHGPTEPPSPRYVDVLYHGLRHYRLLMDLDAAASAPMPTLLRQHLTGLSPALYAMYDSEHRAA
jgi:hypothetical protein